MKKNIRILFVLIISLITMKNATGQNNQWSATDKFRNCMTSMQSTNNELTRFNYALSYFLTEHSTTIQLQDACHYLYSDQKKYELGIASYINIIDKDHFFSIYDDKLEMIKYLCDYSYQQNRFYEFRGELTFNSTQKQLDEFLVGKN